MFNTANNNNSRNLLSITMRYQLQIHHSNILCQCLQWFCRLFLASFVLFTALLELYEAIVLHKGRCVSLSLPAGLVISHQLSVPSPLSDRITSFTSFTRLQLTEQGIHITAVQTNRASVSNYKLASVSATHASILKTEVTNSSSRMLKLLGVSVIITDTPEWNSK
jgi:hypothetical protein